VKVYLVGGAVRDSLLGREIHDRDYVVVGSSVSEMKSLGFIQVGKDFPVFLHPKTNEEYALARKETKSGDGYKGFEFESGDDITLKDDLFRRDFTVNAMALDESQNLFDPFNGKSDLEKRTLRHVSDHFHEDPLRVLRGLRFCADLEFMFAETTIIKIREMIVSNELDFLSKDRVFLEFSKVLNLNRFVELLVEFNLFSFIFPGILFGKDINNLDELLSYRENDTIFDHYTFKRQVVSFQKSFIKFKHLYEKEGLTANSLYQFFKFFRKDELAIVKAVKILKKHQIDLDELAILNLLKEYKSLKVPLEASPKEIQAFYLDFIEKSF